MITTPNLPNLSRWITTGPNPEFNATEALCYAWDAVVAPEVSPNSCVLAARLSTHILHSLGFSAIALPARVMAMNDIMFKHQMDGLHYSQWDERAWSVGAGYQRTDALKVDNRHGRGFDGHVIVMMSSRFLDITASQFSRPGYGIDTHGWINDDLNNFDFKFSFTPSPNMTFIKYNLPEGHMFYEFSEDYGFEDARDWKSNFMDSVIPVLRFMDQFSEEMIETFGVAQ